MPTVGKKKYPYTKAGKAAAGAAKKALNNRGLKKAAKAAATGAAVGTGAGKILKKAGRVAGKIGRSPSQIRKMGAGMKRASAKRKAGKGYKK